MIKAASIQAVRDATEIVEVIGHFLKLDRNKNACCPFHSEKWASFHVFNKTQTYKCFGCGAGGDAIRFVMEHEKLEFIGAIEWLANFYRINLELEDPQQQQRIQKTLDEKKELSQVVEFALKKYQELLQAARPNTPPLLLPDDTRAAAAWDYIFERGLNEDISARWGFGYAPADRQFITATLTNMGKRQPALDAGIVKEGQNGVYAFNHNRVIIPIHDMYGNVTGLAGRWVPTGDEQKDKQGKYLNPPNNALYKKDRTWFGLYQAITAKAFARQKDGSYPPAFVVEGYLDVISWHEEEIYNTVSSSGTAITDEHVKLLKRYTNHAVLVGDGDSAGFNAMLKSIDLFLQHDFKVEAIELPAGQDPDSYARGWAPLLPGDENESWISCEMVAEETA